jgi:hypothetical protein
LDIFIIEKPELKNYRYGEVANINTKYIKAIKTTKNEMLQAEEIRKQKGKLKYWKHLQKLKLQKFRKTREFPFFKLNLNSKTRKISYVRYGNDFLIFVWGYKRDCQEIVKRISRFLAGDLALSLTQTKIKITHLKSQKVEFLGFYIWQSTNILDFTRKYSKSKISKVKKEGQQKNTVLQAPRIRVTFRIKEILNKLVVRSFDIS